MQLYDSIGHGYHELRRPDPRIERAILAALGAADTVLNVGAGGGSYEPGDRPVTAVEPSLTMIRQRPPGAPPVVQATSAALPFGDASFAAALAILTVHHWADRAVGLGEMRRVARERVVILTWDPTSPGFWLTEYFPEILDIDRRIFPSLDDLRAALGSIEVRDLPIPCDCCDGFLGAYWRRPEAYLDTKVRAAISTFSKLQDLKAVLERLEHDLTSGVWHRRFGDLLDRTELDLGYRLIVAAGSERTRS